MVSRRQQKDRRRRAQQHTRRPKVTLPDSWSSDEQWLAWTRDRGLDLSDREQLLDSAAVGLSVLCWRNTAIENVHAGVERVGVLEAQGKDPDDPAVHAEEARVRRERCEAQEALWGDPDGGSSESSRISAVLAGRELGFGIPDDVMMRLNISTPLDVRAVLDETLPESLTGPATEWAYDRRLIPDHVSTIVELLQDPERELTVGVTTILAADIVGRTWDEYVEDVVTKVSVHVRFCDLLGTRRALWHVGLSGALYASGWFPNPWWTRAVALLRDAVNTGEQNKAFHFPEQVRDHRPPGQNFWPRLLSTPAELDGRQCRWVQQTRLRDLIHDVRDADRERLGPLAPDSRFSFMGAIF
jgi:hypothetical protein